MIPGLLELSLVVIIAASLSVLARIFKQPAIIAYIVAGLIVAFLPIADISSFEFFELFSKLGIMFLLFLVGMEVNYTSLKFVGKTAFVLGVGQIIFTSLFGTLIAFALGFAWLEALYIGIALTFSSTVIIIKLLSDKGALQTLHGKISVGFLLVQGFFVILVLIFLAGLQAGETPSLLSAGKTILTGILLFMGAIWAGNNILPKLFNKVARSDELLFVVSLAWLFGAVILVEGVFGLSIEMAGFLAGLALANSSEHYQIAGKMKPLRDFFILLFFVILGASIDVADLSSILIPGIILSLFVLTGNPLIVMTLVRFLGYKRKTGFMTGLTVAQISEFSIILAASALTVGHVSSNTVALITFVGVVTISISTYAVLNSEKLFAYLSPWLRIFEKKNAFEKDLPKEGFEKPIILIGADRTGRSIIARMKPEHTLVVDINPDLLKKIKSRGFEVLYGDISDTEIIETANMENAKTIICTSPSLKDNLTLLERLNNIYTEACVIVRAEDPDDTDTLYQAGATYVMTPHIAIGRTIGDTVSSTDFDNLRETFIELKSKDLEIKKRFTNPDNI